MAGASTVLIVDDDADVRSSLKRVLLLDQYDVHEIGTLSELRSVDNLGSFQFIILDRKLPDGSSDEVLPELKTQAPDTDILVVTGYTDLHGTLAALRHGAEDYLIKPIDPEDLRSTLRRLTQLREMRTALEESEARNRGILETAPVGILTLNEDGFIESINPAIEAITGYPSDELLGKSANILLAPPHRDNSQDQFVAHRFEQNEPGREVMAQRKSGETYPVAITTRKVTLPNGDIITVIVEDITKRKQLEKDVLKASEEEKHRIAQDLHDGLASHLTGVSLLCKMLADGEEGPHTTIAKQISGLIEEAVQQARTVARGLYPVENRPEALMDALGKFAAQLRNDLKIDCRFACPEPVLVKDNTFATHLYRIAQEATNNALRHARAEKIEITLTQSKTVLELHITDDGTGIDEASVDRSNGIGLRTMEYRAGLLQGTLKIGLADGGGTEVTCVVPKNDA